jgi:hypothetical protein
MISPKGLFVCEVVNVKLSFEMATPCWAVFRSPNSPAERTILITDDRRHRTAPPLLAMADKLFEALKLGKKIPDSDVFLFQGSYHPINPPTDLGTDLSFSLNRGDVICVRGPSGCGYPTFTSH